MGFLDNFNYDLNYQPSSSASQDYMFNYQPPTSSNWGLDIDTSNIFGNKQQDYNLNYQTPTTPTNTNTGGNIFSQATGWLGKNSNSLVPIALSLLNAFNKPQQPKQVMSPASGQAYNQAMQIAQGNFNISPVWNKVVDQLMNINAQRGLTPNATSGALRRSIGEAAPAAFMQYAMPALQTAGNVAANAPVQQPADNFLARLIQPYTSMVMAANQARAISPYANSNFSWWPWGGQ